jgi:hypothetical protein
MNESPEGEKALTREDLLKAIDFEIGHRESMLSRHGLSIWGILVALAALSWATLSEVFDAAHDWTAVLFLILVGRFVLGFLASPWVKTFGVGVQLESVGGRGTFQEKLFRCGMNPEILPLAALDLGLMLAISIYLGIQGFYLLAALSGTFYVLLLIAVAFIWLLCRVRIPIKGSGKKGRTNPRLALLAKILIVQAVLVVANTFAQIWPFQKTDVKLGLILAALTSLYGTSITFLQPPPTTNRLRSIRSRLALGQITTLAALQQVDRVVDGSPEEQYLSSKADELIAELREYVRLSEELEIYARTMIALAAKLHATPSDEKVIREVISESRPHFKKITSAFKALDNQTKTAAKLRTELEVRVNAAKGLLSLKPEIVKPILVGVNEAEKEVAAAKKKFPDFCEEFLQAMNQLYQSQKSIVLPPEMTLKKAYVALFQD